MLDSGASTIFLSSNFVKRHKVKPQALNAPIRLQNADGSPNAIGQITHEARLSMQIGGHKEDIVASVANTGDDELIIGVDWLRHHNPEIDWATGCLNFSRCPNECIRTPPPRKPHQAVIKQRPQASLSTCDYQ